MKPKPIIITMLGLAALLGYFLASEDQYQREISEPKSWAQVIADSDAEQAKQYTTLRARK